MAQIIVGSVAVDVVPNATQFATLLRAQIEGPVDAVGQEVGQNLGDAVVEHLSDAIPEGLAMGVPESAEIGDQAGAKFADAFSSQVRTKIDAALKSLPPVDLDANISEVEQKIGEVRAMLEQLGEMDSIDITANDEEVIAVLTELSAYLEDVRRDAETPLSLLLDATEAQASLDALIAKMEATKAAAADLNAELDVVALAQRALGQAMSDDIDAEHKLGQDMANDWDDFAKSLSGPGGATSSVSALSGGLAGLAVVAAPVLGVLIAGAGELVLGIMNAHVETASLKSAWSDLEAEAGKAIQPGLQDAVDHLAVALPQLDPLVDELGTEIGGALDKLATWLGNGGATEIVDYLKTEAPIVGNAFVALATAIGGFIQDTQGVANFLLETFTDALTIITKIETALNSLGKYTASSVASGGNGSPSVSSSQNGSTFGSQLNHAFNDNSGGYQWSSPPTSGDTASDSVHNIMHFLTHPLGVFAPDTTAKPKGAALNTNTTMKYPLNSQALNQATSGNIPSSSMQMPLNAEALNQATSGLDDNSKSLIANAQAYGQTIGQYQSAQAAAAQFAAQTQISTANMQAESNAAGLLQQALAGLGGDDLGVAQSMTAFNQSISSVNASLKTNGAVINGNSDAALANQAAIEASVSAAQAHAQAIANNTGSTEQATAAYTADIDALKKQLTATGASTDQIDAFIESIDKIPPLVPTKIDVDDAAATAALANFKSALYNATHVDAGVVISANNEAILRVAAGQADGSLLQFFADGAHVAQMAPAGAMRVWAEPETGGESYIPHAASKRVRSEAILSETANLFGGAYIPRGARNFADGMVLRGSGSGSAGGHGGMSHEHPINILFDGKTITKVVNEQNKFNGRL